MKLKTTIALLLVLFLSTSFKVDIFKLNPVFNSVLDDKGNLLFYLKRTINSNTIIYELNTDDNGNIIEKEPIKIYWIKHTNQRNKDPLTYIQRTYAYGLQYKLIDEDKKSFVFEFVSYRKRKFYLLRSTVDNKYHVYGYVNDKLSILNNIFVTIEGGTFWVPKIKSVEIIAQNPDSHEFIIEVIKP